MGSSPLPHPEQYAFTVFGNPAPPTLGWRVEGHSLNFTVAPNDFVTVTPAFLEPTQPECRFLPKGLRTLDAEQELARKRAEFGTDSASVVIAARPLVTQWSAAESRVSIAQLVCH